MAAKRDRFEQLLTEGLGPLRINGGGAPRTWNTTNIAFPGTEAQFLVVVLSEHGLAVSGGAACASGSIEASPVLHALGVPPELAAGSIRFSLSRYTTDEEVNEGAALTLRALKAAAST